MEEEWRERRKLLLDCTVGMEAGATSERELKEESEVEGAKEKVKGVEEGKERSR